MFSSLPPILEKIIGFEADYPFVIGMWLLIFARVTMMLLFTPFIGSRTIPTQPLIAASMTLTTFVYMAIAPAAKAVFPTDWGLYFLLFAKEFFFGFTVGLITLMFFYALESAGRIVDAQRGGATAELFVPALGQVTSFGLFNYWLAIAFFLSIGGHRYFLEAFFLSFNSVPVLKLPSMGQGISPFLEFIIKLSGDVLVIAVQMAAPVIIAILLVDLVLGIANKMAPQINVFELGFAIKGYIAPLMIWVAILVLVTQMDVILKNMVKAIYEISSLFGGNA